MRGRLIAIACSAIGCNVLFGFEEIHPVDANGDASGSAPRVFSSPGPHGGGYWFVAPATVTLAADDPTTVIYYTTDGSMPTANSPHGTTPVKGISIPGSATLTYFGSAASVSAPVSEQYVFDTTKTGSAGYYIYNVTLDGTSPVLVVHPGQVVAGATATVKVWTGTGCGSCSMQVVVGVDDMDQGCIYDGDPGLYSSTALGVVRPFTVTAPMNTGVHPVRVGDIEQTNCALAMGSNTLKYRPDLSQIGVLIVQ